MRTVPTVEATRETVELDPSECWRLLESSDLGRVAIRNGEDIDIFPINFLVHDGTIYFRSAPGNKLIDLTMEPRVSFESDGIADRNRWSVVVKGVARRLSSEAEIRESRVLTLESFSPTDKWNYVRIEVAQISGRRFRRQSRAHQA